MSMTNHQKDQILNVVQYYMTPELRERIMREVPVAYNAWVGYAVVEVKEVETSKPCDDRMSEAELEKLREDTLNLAFGSDPPKFINPYIGKPFVDID
jgi:hypothetical protein